MNTSGAFVGRAAEQQAFAATLEELATAKRRPFGKAPPPGEQARVFLVHGSGGMGKTWLLGRLGEQCQARGDVRWVLLNWDDVHEATNLPKDFPDLLVRLHDALAQTVGKPAQQHFKAFTATHENHGKLQEKVKRYSSEARAEHDKLVALTAAALGRLAGAIVSVPGTDQVVSAGVSTTVHAGAAGLAKVEDFVSEWLEQRLSKEEYRLYKSPNDEYAQSFVEGLVSLSAAQPLVIAQDTYEWISRSGDLDGQLRARVIKPALQDSETLAVVVAGRDDLSGDYRRAFESKPHLLHLASLKPFTADEIRELLPKYGLQPDLSEWIERATRGVPWGVDTLATLLKETGPERVATHFTDLEAVVDAGEAIRQVTTRFLRYIFESPHDPPEIARQKRLARHQIYALALLRKYEPSALAACWGALENGVPLSDDAVFERLQRLRQHNEFLFERGHDRMQKEVHHFVREYLRQQIRPDSGSLERNVVRRLNQAALNYYQQALAERERSLPTLAERADDAEWRSLCLSALNHRFWLDEHQALQDLTDRALEAGNFHLHWLPELVQVAQEAQPGDHGLLQALEAGVQSLLSEAPSLDVVQTMWDEIGGRGEKWKLPPLYRALLANRRGRVLAAGGRPKEAAREFEAGLEALPAGVEPLLREDLVNGMAGAAGILSLEAHDYEQAISVAERALRYDPDHPRAQHMRVMGLMGRKDYDGALALLDDLVDKYPDRLEFSTARWSVYMVQQRTAEAADELRRIAKLRPDFAQEIVRNIVDLGKDANARKNILEWGRDVGMDAKSLEVFSKLQSTLSPEALTEFMSAQLELMALEKPTPDQVVRVRELAVRYLPDWPDVHAELGVAYLSAGRLGDALAAFERARSLAPENPALATVPGLLLFWNGHYAEALPFLEQSVQMLPDNPGPVLMILSCLYELGRKDEAKTRAESAVQAFPQVAMLRWQYGQFLLESGDGEEGWRIQHEAYVADPTIVEQMVRGLLLRGDLGLETVRQSIREAGLGEDIRDVLLDLPPADMVRLYFEIILRARLASKTFGKLALEVWIPAFEELLARKPDSAEIRVLLADVYRKTGREARAIPLLAEFVEHAPQPEREQMHQMLLVTLYDKSGETALAIHHLQKFIETSPIPQAYSALAHLYENVGEDDKALDAYDKALALAEEEDPENLQHFGLLNLSVGRPKRAEEILRMLIARQPDHANAHEYLAEALYRQGRYPDARAAGERALALVPESPLPAARLFRICRAMDLSDEAEAYRQKALQSLPSVTTYDQACVLALLGQPEEALARLAEVFKEQPEQRVWAARDPDLHELRGNAVFQEMIRV